MLFLRDLDSYIMVGVYIQRVIEWVGLIRHFYDIMRMLGICCHGEVM